MIKKILKGLGVAFLVLITLFIGLGVWAGYKSSAYEETAVPYIKQAVPEISKWDAPTMKSYMSSETFEGVSDPDFNQVVLFLSKMGAFISMEEPVFQRVNTSASVQQGSGTFVHYTIAAKYENGDANIIIALKEIDNGFEVYHFNVNSMALTK